MSRLLQLYPIVLGCVLCCAYACSEESTPGAVIREDIAQALDIAADIELENDGRILSDIATSPDTDEMTGDGNSPPDDVADANHVDVMDVAVDDTVVDGDGQITSPDGFDTRDTVVLPTLTWNTGPPLPSARVGSVVGALSGQLMIASGEGPEGTLTGDVQLYNTASDIWGQGASFAPVRRYATGAVLQSQLYVVLGLAPNNQGLDSMVRYNPAQNAWKVLLSNPNPGCCAGAGSAAGRLWVIGGRGAGTLVESFSPSQGIWFNHAPIPVGTSFPAVVVAPSEDMLYAIGGTSADSPNAGTTSSGLYGYSILTDEWTVMAPMPEPRAAASAVWFKDRIWVFGGETSTLPAQDSVFVYSPLEDSWSVAAPMPYARSRHGSAVIDSAVYLLGGINNEGAPVVSLEVAI